MLHLQPELTPFIGRDKELDDLARLLADPKCRLITLVGPGGSGKTRLAIEVAKENAAHYADGAHFVTLQPVSSGEFLVSAISDAIRYSLRGSDEQGQLLDYLHNKKILLVLDNFEHLLSEADLLHAVLGHAPDVKLLVTSREVLNLREEWLYPVHGMPFPEDEAASDLEHYGAVQLFVGHAQRVQRDFSLDAERTHVVRLSQVVEGMPLALELAATWLKSLPCSAIVGEIEHSLDFLDTTVRDIPVRHRSMRTVFDQSWKLLTPLEQAVFRRLSVFRGSFLREAAEQVAGASLPVLSVLVDKSLIWREPGGRYQIHELLRQYTAEQLAQDTEENRLVHDKHAEYYLNFLGQRGLLLYSSRERETIKELDAELDNIRAAWRQAVQQANLPALQKGAYPYYELSDMQGRYQEIVDAIPPAIQRLESLEVSEERDFTLGILHNATGGMLIRLGRFEEARTAFQTSIRLLRKIDKPLPPGFGTAPLTGLGLLATTVGDYEQAVQFGEQAIDRIDSENDKPNLIFALYVLANATYALGQLEAANRYARRAYQLNQSLGGEWFSAYILVVMGNIAQAMEEYDRAWDYYETSIKFKENFDDLGGVAFALNCMGRIAWLRGDYDESARLYRKGCNLYREVNDPGGLATSIFGLGDAAQATKDFSAARDYFRQALEIALDIHWSPLILMIVTGVSDLWLKTGNTEQAVEMLALAMAHPANEPPVRRRAEQLLAKAQTVLAPNVFDAAKTRGESADLDTVTQSLWEQLPLADSYAEQTPPRDPVKQGLIDPLTDRELEILRLLADGLTNQQIAEKLMVVLGTVKTHNHNIFSKLDVTNRVQAISRARALDLL